MRIPGTCEKMQSLMEHFKAETQHEYHVFGLETFRKKPELGHSPENCMHQRFQGV